MATLKPKPWPGDAIIEGVLVRLVPLDQSGSLLIGKRIDPLDNISPTDYSYTSQAPYVERTALLRLPVNGMGEQTQSSPTTRAYAYALGIDASIGGYLMLAPEIVSHLPTFTGPGRVFVEALHANTLTLFCAAGQYMLRRDGDTSWAVSKDFGTGRRVLSAVRFKNAGASPRDALYVTLDNGEFWRYDGTTWAQAAGMSRYILCVWLNELWASDGANTIRKVSDDPFTAANWSAAYTIGDASATITWMAVTNNQLFIFHSNGKISTLLADGSARELFTVTSTRSDEHGVQAIPWANALWAPIDGALYKITGGTTATLEGIGPERLLENTSPVHGRVTCFAGHSTWFGYAGVWNPITNTSYLLKYGTWVNPESIGEEHEFASVWHGALAQWPNRKMTSMLISSIPGPNPRLYMTFDTGHIEYCILPRGSPNPTTDTNCRFQTQGDIFWPRHHAMFQADSKYFRGVSVFGPVITDAQRVDVLYKTQATPTFTPLPDTFLVPDQRVNFPENTYGKWIDLQARLSTTDPTKTPVIEGLALHEEVRPALRLEYSLIIDARPVVPLHNGAFVYRTAEKIHEIIRRAASLEGTIRLMLPTGETIETSLRNYQEILDFLSVSAKHSWRLPLVLVQFKTITVYGTIERLKPYTIGDLNRYNIRQLGVL